MSKQDGSGRQVTAYATDDATAGILHVDMDAFFASVELLEHPELVGLPVVVGHRSQRSVVTAATYEARKYGVNSAMPMAVALRRCPQAIVLEPHFERYRHFSSVVMSMFDDVTPLVERLGIDEAFLDVTGSRRLLGSTFEIATALRRRVFAETGLHCSIGAASTKFVAKLASSVAKPDGLLIVPHDETIAFLHPRPIGALWGVGGRTEEVLRGYGLATIGDVAHAPLEFLQRAIGQAGGAKIHALSWGRDPRRIETRVDEKSVGHEVTFEHDVADADQIRRELFRLSDQVGRRLRAAGASGRTVVLKLRFGDFTTITRSKTLAEPTDLGRRIYEEVRGVYEASGKQLTPIRLVGVRLEQLTLEGGSSGAVGLWDDDADWREAETTMDALRARFGPGSVTSASLLGTSTKRLSRGTRPERRDTPEAPAQAPVVPRNTPDVSEPPWRPE
ncbi:DNA polymerase IV [Frondihabitans sp. 762G35]|uniref:DNA polymerase IV n=1 Tax=Frondihabitans sp. 762G35 TaxID=1446794 RepID=UPI000D20BF6E|nr:DNA polymerase IV [Frondihabitans sp. 762G35]ARC56836.1 DNA polymerase IV [Frondihabitans sp. 762G35]